MADRSQRDRSIEHLLKQGAAGPHLPATPARCVDGELLAAWSSGALDPGEASRVEAHLADCARCQAMFAAFVGTEPLAAAASPWWRRTRSRWLVPLATAAAVAAIWVATPQKQNPTPATPGTVDRVEPSSGLEYMQPPARRVEPPPRANEPLPPTPERPRDTQGSAAPPENRARVADAPAEAAAPPPSAIAESMAASAPRAQALKRAEAELEIVAPGGQDRWRIRGGQVQRWTPQGGNWDTLPLPADVTVTAGYSPAVSVAWLVGKRGVILLTTDGTHFESVPFVRSADLAAVVAVDDQQATVTTLDGRRFRTLNRGRSWLAAP